MTKTLFLGSNWEALKTLKTLVEDSRFEIIGLITQPDKPVGRKKELKETEIKQYAKEVGIKVFHTQGDPSKYEEAIQLFKPELIVCKSFGEFLPKFFVEYPKYKTINVHYSLLPKYRGAVPIQKAILEGDKTTGITYVQMVEKMDAGPILSIFEEKIQSNDTNQSLRERLVEITTRTIGDTLQNWIDGKIEAKEQSEADATYCWQKDISKENAYIDFTVEEPIMIDRKVRAFIPWPIAWTLYKEKRLKLFEVKLSNHLGLNLKPGVYKVHENSLFVGSRSPQIAIQLIDVQLEGKNRISGSQFANSHDQRS